MRRCNSGERARRARLGDNGASRVHERSGCKCLHAGGDILVLNVVPWNHGSMNWRH